jgi:hypothetical protein
MIAAPPDTKGVKLPSDKIRMLAWWGQLMCVICLATSLGSVVLAIADKGWRDHMLFGGTLVNGAPPVPLPEELRAQLVFILLPIVLCQAFAFTAAWLLFRGYRQGEIFTSSAAKRLTQIGYAILAMAPANLIMKIMMTRMMANTSMPETITFAFTLSDFDFTAVGFGLLAIIIGRVLGEAAKLSEENRLFV